MAKKIRTDHNEELFEKLKNIRNKIAKEKNVANFIVFSDAVLRELSYYFPLDKKMFLAIKGIGENKFDKYGSKFLLVIENYLKDMLTVDSKQLTNKRHEELKASVKPVKPKINIKERTEKRKARVRELILKKMSIEDVATDLDLTPTTIVNYIGRLLTDDPKLDVRYIKDSVEGYDDIVKAFEKYGTEKIGPIYAEFGGNVEYSNISLVKVLILSRE